MTTYTLTLSDTDDYGALNGEQDVFSGLTMAEVKSITKRNCSSIANWAKERKGFKESPKAWYYRGSQVVIIEERQNGWTLVHDTNNGQDRYAVTSELEYR